MAERRWTEGPQTNYSDAVQWHTVIKPVTRNLSLCCSECSFGICHFTFAQYCGNVVHPKAQQAVMLHKLLKTVRVTGNKTKIKPKQNSFKTVLKLLCFSQNKTLRPQHVFRCFCRWQSLSAVCAPDQRLGTERWRVCGYRLWLAATAKTFRGCFSVLFWLKQNRFEFFFQFRFRFVSGFVFIAVVRTVNELEFTHEGN